VKRELDTDEKIPTYRKLGEEEQGLPAGRGFTWGLMKEEY